MAQIRVMLVDDSVLFTGALKQAIDKDPTATVVGTATNGLDALEKVGGLRPDVIICDVQMPKMSGIEFVKALLPKYKIPVVVISGAPGVTLSALASGAVDFIAKPAAGEPKDAFFRRVLSTVHTAASANVGAKMAVNQAKTHKVGQLLAPGKDIITAIGASTGGTDAILAVVRDLPANYPPVLVTQHMPAGFTAMYAERLNRESKMQVREAKDGDRLEQGLILLAPGDKHLRLRKDTAGYFATCRPGEKVNGHMPSVDVLFDSVAEVAKARSMGVILTGMGGDGANGLVRMRKTGAYTIGQDKETSVVYGMPMMAFNKGGVTKQLPLHEIPDELIRQLNKAR